MANNYNAFNISFNGVTVPDYVRINGVDTQILPDLSVNSKNRVGGTGVIWGNTIRGAKLFKVKFQLIPLTPTVMSNFMAWLKGDNFKPCSLIMPDNTNIVYKALVQNSTEIADKLTHGEGTIEFLVPDGYGTHITDGTGSYNSTTKTMTMVYDGTAPSAPTIHFHPHISYTGFELKIEGVSMPNRIFILGDFASFTNNYIYCASKYINTTGTIGMENLELNFTNWFRFDSAGTYQFTVNTTNSTDDWTCSWKRNFY